ncbi:Ldh family oxidoreductase [Cognatishimia activa]|uniref:Ldh family oxidoreductase n=1 Tax=Cognatishimia activa TaxID=1715691 RepID=A0A975I841_9RHOB|nr:Ldh family oxidoreductase [Cognatishimia activa]QTN36853.1 Ldh family oxidoreductase [Cognatishimia activa]
MSDVETISLSEARSLMTRAFRAAGAPEATAASVAAALVQAEAEGQVGHGFSRLSDYVAQAKSGKVDADAVPQLSKPSATAIHVDAGNGFAYPALDLASATLIETAQTHGCAFATISNSHHCGALSVQVDRLAQAGLVGIMMANTPKAIAPWGAKDAMFGTNPIAFAVPRADEPPMVIDLSLSVVARGKVMHAKKSGNAIPAGWAFDAEGNPTTDPEAALAGTMAPIGGAKGTALALMVEILAASMTGANRSTEMSSFFTADGPPTGAGQFLMALKPHDAEGFSARLEPLLADIAGLEGARLPGTRRIVSLENAQENGLSVPKAYLDQARELEG